MSHFQTSDDEIRDLLYGDDYRAYLMARSRSADDYRFGRTQGKRARVHARNALRHVAGYFRTMIEAIANSKLRRMERELELRGIRFDRSNESRVASKSRPTERQQ
jgi:hypothetical protein